MLPYSKTVYSVVWPETEAHVRAFFSENLDLLIGAHRDPHLGSQVGMERGFASAWRAFAAPFAEFRDDDFPHFFPLAGSSEGIREIINELRGTGDLVVFEGEYEGYAAIAEAAGIPVWRVDRARWREVLSRWAEVGAPWGDRPAQWWISQPSSIDGNQWTQLLPFLNKIQELGSAPEVWWDAAYVGTVAKPQAVPVRHPALTGMVFSLSKAAGVYYRRIGGCFSRRPVPGLWGNQWFKNIDSVLVGESWLRARYADSVWRKHGHRQAQALATLVADPQVGALPWRASEVMLLAYCATAGVPAEVATLLEPYRRGDVFRVCLTPALVASIQQDAAQ